MAGCDSEMALNIAACPIFAQPGDKSSSKKLANVIAYAATRLAT